MTKENILLMRKIYKISYIWNEQYMNLLKRKQKQTKENTNAVYLEKSKTEKFKGSEM